MKRCMLVDGIGCRRMEHDSEPIAESVNKKKEINYKNGACVCIMIPNYVVSL